MLNRLIFIDTDTSWSIAFSLLQFSASDVMKDLSVVLVDHNPLFSQLITRFLQSEEQMQVLSVSSVQEDVLRKVGQVAPEVVLIDLDSSVKDSLRLIQEIRSVLSEGLIIAITLLDTVYYRKAVIDAGADDLVYKMDMGSNFLIDLHSRLAKRRRGKLKTLPSLWLGQIRLSS